MIKKKKKRLFKKIVPITTIILMIVGVIFCYINTMPMQKSSSKVTINIKQGQSTREIIHLLKKKKLIRMEKFLYVYVKLHNINGIKAGTFELNRNNSLKEIFNILTDSNKAKSEDLTITFPEGLTINKISKIIEENTKYSKEEVLNQICDKEYIKTLISEYWFLDDVILDENIYYPLEGYLFPDTYNFKKDVTIKEIFKTMLNQTDKILKDEKLKLSDKYSVHQLITLASIIESEGGNLEERKNIAGVFINRLKANMPLGSDVTTYYASKIELGERDLYKSEIESTNLYNTRSVSNAGKLPIGPICNPSKSSIIAAIEFNSNDYYYFVADKNGKIYFSKNSDEHNKIIKKLKKDGLWFEY